MRLKEIPVNTVIHTPTEQEAEELMGILHTGGYSWCGGGSLEHDSSWGFHRDETCYCIEDFHELTQCSEKYFRQRQIAVITLSEFKELYAIGSMEFELRIRCEAIGGDLCSSFRNNLRFKCENDRERALNEIKSIVDKYSE